MDLLIIVQPHDMVWLRYTLPTTQRILAPVCTYLLTFDVTAVQAMFPECRVVSLSRLPFTLDDVRAYTQYPMTYFTQLARLYAPDVLVLRRPFLCLDADTVVLQTLPPVGGRHPATVSPYVASHLRTLHPDLCGLQRSTDVPYYIVEPARMQALHVSISTLHGAPFWRIYLTALSPYGVDQGASDKQLYVAWASRTQQPMCIENVVWKKLVSYADVTPLMADAHHVHVATCPPVSQSILACFQASPWKRISRWFGTSPIPTLPLPPTPLKDLIPGTVVHYGCGETPSPWDGWTYIGVDVNSYTVLQARTYAPTIPILCLDICVDPLPSGSLAVCTDLIHRLGYAHLLTFMLRLQRTYARVFFVDYIPRGAPRINTDHATGTSCAVWWDLPPYNVWNVKEHGRVPMDDGTLYVFVWEA